MDVNEYVGLLRRHSVLIVVSLLVCAAAAGIFAWTQTPIYSARTQLFVSTRAVSADPGQTYEGGLFSQQRVLSYAQIVSSPPVMRAVIKELRLPESIQQLQAKIHTSVPTGTVLINATVRDRSPQRTKAVADAVAEQFSRFVSTLETPDGGSGSPVKVSITSPAQLPIEPVSPRKPLYLALGVLVGLALGVGGAVFKELLDDRVRGEDDAVAIVGAPVLGSIAEDPRAKKRPLSVVSESFSLQAEAYRRLRTNLDVLSRDNNPRSFVVSSAVASEGKTTVVANLGVAFAQAGYRVILVDADLRRPNLAEVMGLSSGVGLTDVLIKKMQVEAALQTWSLDLPLEVLGSGPEPPNPSELLGSQWFASMLKALGKRADLVILDAPALLLATDAAILARLTSGVILVSRVATTRAEQLDIAAQAVRTVDGQLLGVVLNRLPTRGARPRRHYGYAAERSLDHGNGPVAAMRTNTEARR
jgi:succinoglycan biosynthesis transport protein ExoP